MGQMERHGPGVVVGDDALGEVARLLGAPRSGRTDPRLPDETVRCTDDPFEESGSRSAEIEESLDGPPDVRGPHWHTRRIPNPGAELEGVRGAPVGWGRD